MTSAQSRGTMPAELIDFLNIVFRYIHIVAAIMWIGNSLLFTWMEINLIKDPNNPKSLGYMNMLHAGGVFFLEKRVISKNELPEKMHRFLWQSYTTWISGFVLLVTLFYTRGSSLMIDGNKTDLAAEYGILISLGGIIGGWLFYDNFWKTPIKNRPFLGITICLMVVFAFATWLDTIFNSRFVYLQIGAMLGTLMSANVFFRIIPNQRKIMAALLEGKPHDLELGHQAKIRSKMNHYITFPVIFLMLSAHFPTLYGAEHNIIIMAIIVISLIIIKHMMNIYNTFDDWLFVMIGTFVFGTALVTMAIFIPSALSGEASHAANPGAKLFQSKGCNACHQPVSSSIAPTLHGLFNTEVTLTSGEKLIADEAYIRNSILNPTEQVVEGYPPAMPKIANDLSDEQLEHLVEYIKSL